MKPRFILYPLAIAAAIWLGWILNSELVEPEIRTEVQVRTVLRTVEVEKVVYRYPNSAPYQELPDPIDYDQAIALLEGMRLSHVQVLDWKWASTPKGALANRDFQEKCIKWYDQLIEFVQRQEIEGKD